MIVAQGLVKRYGGKTAVDDLSFTVRPGLVTGFLGPNGAGKSTTMRMIVGLDAPDAGTATVNGKRYAEHRRPLREVGVMLEARAVHTGRSARDHLAALAATHGISRSRVSELIDMVGLREVAAKRVGGFSLGMGQRLGIACALLGDPNTVILDEPVNGLDPEGVRWVRQLLRGLAAEGRTVFVSSHLMSEMALTADHIIVVGRGRLIADAPIGEFVDRAAASVRVRTPEADRLISALADGGATAERGAEDELVISGMSCEDVGLAAFRARVPLLELTPQRASLEEAYMELTGQDVEYRSSLGGMSAQNTVERISV